MELVRGERLQPPPIDDGEVVVDRPPAMPTTPPTNLVARFMPLVMLVAMVGMTALYFTSGASSGGTAARSPMFMFFPVMMLVSMVGSLAYGARGSQRGAELDEHRRSYLRYLHALDDALARSAMRQHESGHWSHPDPGSLWTLAGGARMWERRPTDTDYRHVRVGVGPAGPSTKLVVPDLGRSDVLDPVTAGALHELAERWSAVPGLPVTIDLGTQREVVIDGEVEAARALARAMVCQLAVLHAPRELTITAVTGDTAPHEWDWLKWLPHHGTSHDLAEGARTVVIVDGGDAAAVAALPAYPTVVAIGVSCSGEGTRIDVDTAESFDRPDALTRSQAVVCARQLAPYSPGSPSSTATGWPGLVGIADPRCIDVTRAWRRRPAARRLRVPIGLSDTGEPVELDLKEAARGGMGPHGLCVGATGSGKSEFLRTLTLGLIATHEPDALNLVLVDFKGGATFLGFERLRHVAAVITNLAEEAHLVERTRDALAGEMTRRQEVLRAGGRFANLTDYDAARASGAALEPMPALFIIVDEFSELLSQHPDFAELFVAIGRVGRSLGMHLLLASQRLDEGRLRGLETHLSYRVCLKTFSASESRAVLGTADAYELPGTPGVAYLRTVDGDLVRFRTAYVSAPVTALEAHDEVVPRVFDARPVGRTRAIASPATATTMLDNVIDGFADRGAPAHRVWLPPLSASPALGAMLARTDQARVPLVVPIGLVDNPFAQRQDTLVADLRTSGGHVAVAGGPRAGKSTTLCTLVLALAATHDPGRVQFYGLDFGGGSLSALRALPHVGTIAGRAEHDLARRIVARLQGLVRDSVTRRRGSDFAHDVFLVIDGWAAVRQECDGVEEAVTGLAAQGLSVGVHVVVAASRWADIRPALKDQLGTRIELRLGDPAESEMDRRRARALVDRPPGRGITRDGLELVVALPPFGDALLDMAAALCARHPGQAAPPVELLPVQVPYDGIVQRSPGRAVLGLGGDDLQPVAVDFGSQPHLLILGDAECGKTATLRALCREIVRTCDADAAQVLVVDLRRTLLGVVDGGHLAGYAMSEASIESHVAALVSLLATRMPGESVSQRQLRDRSWWSGPEQYVVVDDYDLVAGAAGNPLTPLLDLLPHARDVGLHLVIARRSGGAARAMFDPILARVRDLGCMGLMMSAGPDEGVLLGSTRPSALPPGRGNLVRRGRPDLLIQVPWTERP